MITIDIWTASAVRGARRQNGRGAYKIRASDGAHATERMFGVHIRDMTANTAELFVLTRAAMYVDRILSGQMDQRTDIRVHTDSGYIRSNWYLVKMWRSNGWKGRKGQDIKNVVLWQMVDDLLFSRTVNPVWEEDMQWLREAAGGTQ